jgi:hypothetical protein
MLEEIREQGRVRNRITRFRRRSGEIVDTFYSADTLDIDGQPCVLAISADVPDRLAVRSSVTGKVFDC